MTHPSVQSCCVYCGSNGPFSDEHVLSRAFLGAADNWVLKNLVCADCNGRFSKYERRWSSQPGISHARILYGPTGRPRRGQAFQAHPSQNWFLVANDDDVCYEVDILREMIGRLRVQCIATDTDVIIRAGDQDDFKRFTAAFNAFTKKPEITLQKRIGKSERQYRVAVLDLTGLTKFDRIELRKSPTNVWLDRFPFGAAHGVTLRKDPRVSVDPDGQLRFRVNFLRDISLLLDQIFAKEQFQSDGGTHAAGKYGLICRESVDVGDDSLTFRAIAKTAVNFAVDEMGPSWIASVQFRNILDFCIGKGTTSTYRFVGIIGEKEQPTGEKEIDDIRVDRHAIMLLSNGKRVICLIRMYGATVYRVHLGEAPKGTQPFKRWVHIDYNGPGRVPKR